MSKSNIYLIIIVIAMWSFVKCNGKQEPVQLINLDEVEEFEGFVDLPFSIVEQIKKDGYQQNKVQAIAKGDTLEMVISLKLGIPPGYVNGVPKNVFINDGIMIESTGSRSDKLLQYLNARYGLVTQDLRLRDKQVLTCANLNRKPVNYNSGTPKFKVFLEKESEYAEMYVNFDFVTSTISFNEKDPGYRQSLINLMKR
jgi:hypothetical protein